VRSDLSDDEEAVTAPLAPGSDQDSDGESISDVEERLRREARRKNFLLGNTGAGVSQTHISSAAYGTYNDDGEENEEAILVGRDDYDSDEFDDEGKPGLSSKAGIILGIHNIFIVIPQFLVTGLSALIFAIFDPQKSVISGTLPGNSTSTPLNNSTTSPSSLLVKDAPSNNDQPDSVVYIFRIGGFSALIAFVLCYRLARELRHR